MAEHQDMTRTLLAELNEELAGRGGEAWAERVGVGLALEGRGDLLDEVCGHPYTYTWLEDTLAALREERQGALALALRLPSYLAAALVARPGHHTGPRCRTNGGRLRLPTLGEFGCAARRERRQRRGAGRRGGLPGRRRRRGAAARPPRRPDGEGSDWRPVRTLGGRDGVPLLRLDDLDPYRDCFGAPCGTARRAERRPSGTSG